MAQSRPLTNQVAIVTGSTAGIGLAIARDLGCNGAKVVVSSRKQNNVDKAVSTLRNEGLEVEGVMCHVGNADDRKKLVDFTLQKYGRIDILINNAAQNPHFGDILEITEQLWDKLFNSNVKSAFMLSKLCVPHMERQGGGNIVFISSIAGYSPNNIIGAYGVTKTTLLGLTKALALACAHRNIRVNCVAPGLIKTDFSRALWEGGSDAATANIPMQRAGTADECADKAAYITGESVAVGGGVHSRL